MSDLTDQARFVIAAKGQVADRLALDLANAALKADERIKVLDTENRLLRDLVERALDSYR